MQGNKPKNTSTKRAQKQAYWGVVVPPTRTTGRQVLAPQNVTGKRGNFNCGQSMCRLAGFISMPEQLLAPNRARYGCAPIRQSVVCVCLLAKLHKLAANVRFFRLVFREFHVFFRLPPTPTPIFRSPNQSWVI